ncbi:MAG: dephospho-CoA kinase [Proteobacteria bacterium]|nr:MAG: dephospho-CoA kinase [Pseudomonadota bacterium]
MKTILITGGIASGKTLVSKTLRSMGCPVIDADQIARNVVQPGSLGLARVLKAFGSEFQLADGSLNRRKMRNHIARHKPEQEKLNRILFPIIRSAIEAELNKLRQENHQMAFVEAALAIESGSYKTYDTVLLVTAPRAIRMKRLLARDGMTEPAARGLMDKQMSDEEKSKLADFILVNDKSPDELIHKVKNWLKDYLEGNSLKVCEGFKHKAQKLHHEIG